MLSTSLLVLGPLTITRRELPLLMARLRELPPLGVLAFGLCGVALLFVGARSRRPLAMLGGAVLGYLAATVAPAWVATNIGISRGALGAAIAAILAVGGGLYPPLFIATTGVLAGGIAGALLSTQSSAELGVMVGAITMGVAALFMARWVAAATAAVLGATLISAAILATGTTWPALRIFSDRPFTLLTLTAVLTVAGVAFQAGNAWPASGFRGRGGMSSDQEPTVPDL